MSSYKVITKFWLIALVVFVAHVDLQKLEGGTSSGNGHGICLGRTIRNSPKYLRVLRNCTIILGSLDIAHLDLSFSNDSFPELREVTNFVSLYLVSGLKSLASLFPNLGLIRGRRLRYNYALIISTCKDMIEVGLYGLTTIERGWVRIERNNKICDSIDWAAIAGPGRHHVRKNSDQFLCPGRGVCRGCDYEFCWNSMHCQKIVPNDPADGKCHPECLGCSVLNNNTCKRCRHFTNNFTCVENCPTGKVALPEAKYCITIDECTQVKARAYNGCNGGSPRRFVWAGECVDTCPYDHELICDGFQHTCRPCSGYCNRVCNSTAVFSLEHADNYKGCTKINGSLQINIKWSHSVIIFKELEQSFSDLREIRDYLYVYRSRSITSLNFFKKLRVIGGESLYQNRYAIAIHEMESLRSVFTSEVTKNIEIRHGLISLHDNRKLCLKNVNSLLAKAYKNNTENYSPHDVSNQTNGYLFPCHEVILNTSAKVFNKTSVNVTWSRIMPSRGSVEGYLLYYIESPIANISIYFGRDTCYESWWQNVYVSDHDSESSMTNLTVTLHNLKHSTQYGYYIKTEDPIDQDNTIDGQSNLTFFTTEIEKPPPPKIYKIFPMSYDSVFISWLTHETYRGNVTRFIIETYRVDEDPSRLDGRNYCMNPISLKNPDIVYSAEDSLPLLDMRTPVCDCRKKWFSELSESIKVYDDAEESFDVCALMEANEQPGFPRGCASEEKIYDNCVKGFCTRTEVKSPDNFTRVNNLKHFSSYIVKLRSCTSSEDEHCSIDAQEYIRTWRHPAYDTIEYLDISVTNETATLHWKEPSPVNGAILSYYVEYVRTDLINIGHNIYVTPLTKCITRKEHEDNKYKIDIKLSAGAYKVRVRAVSLAGYGPFTNETNINIEKQKTEKVHSSFNWTLYLFIFVYSVLTISTGCYLYRRIPERKQDDSEFLLEDMELSPVEHDIESIPASSYIMHPIRFYTLTS